MKSDGENIMPRIQEIITLVRAQIALARELRKNSQNLIQQSADLQEFRHERLLTALSRREKSGW